MFYSRRDLICSFFWIVLISIVAYVPFQVKEPTKLEHPELSSLS